MYLNTNKENTNIDSQFKNKKSKEMDFGKLKLPMIIGGVFLLIIVILSLVLVIKNKNKYFIELEGNSEITMYQGTEYIEPGYYGRDKKGHDLTKNIKIDNRIDINSVGSYEIIYKLKNITKKRKINIIEKDVGSTSIYLKGKDNIILNINDTYNEPGYIAIDSVDGDISNKVKITNNIDTTKEGTYRIVYSIVNSSGITTTKTRTIIISSDMKKLPVEK